MVPLQGKVNQRVADPPSPPPQAFPNLGVFGVLLSLAKNLGQP